MAIMTCLTNIFFPQRYNSKKVILNVLILYNADVKVGDINIQIKYHRKFDLHNKGRLKNA